MNICLKSFLVFLTFTFFISCQEDDAEIGEIIPPSGLEVTTEVVGRDTDNPNGDGSGMVMVSAHAEHAISYKFVSNGVEENAPTGTAFFTYSTLGVNTYQITAIAYGAGGISTSTTIEVEVLATYSPPQDLLDKLIGDGDKMWRVKAEVPGHFGLGPVGGTTPVEWYGAAANEKSGSGMYDDRFRFLEDGTFEYITNIDNDDNTGTIFGRDGLIDEITTGGEVQEADVLNAPYNDYTASWTLTAPGGVETLNLSGNAFIGYYVGGSHSYEIFNRTTPNEMTLRTTDGNGEFDWWFVITSAEPGQTDPEEPTYDNLIWTDEFEGEELNTEFWNYEIGTGTNGWGNNEAQYYTDRSENVQVSDGTLKIIAQRENYEGSEFTSARITTQDKFEFTYGRVEIRAKMAGGGGTWPALWMLGANFDEVGWPASGEIDILEYVGNNPDEVSSAMHFPGNSAGNAPNNSIAIENAESEFHIYECIWSPDNVRMLVDGTEILAVPNSADLPFNADFFMIFNVAMGGTLGGQIAEDFDSSTMEVDYINVYQE